MVAVRLLVLACYWAAALANVGCSICSIHLAPHTPSLVMNPKRCHIWQLVPAGINGLSVAKRHLQHSATGETHRWLKQTAHLYQTGQNTPLGMENVQITDRETTTPFPVHLSLALPVPACAQSAEIVRNAEMLDKHVELRLLHFSLVYSSSSVQSVSAFL